METREGSQNKSRAEVIQTLTKYCYLWKQPAVELFAFDLYPPPPTPRFTTEAEVVQVDAKVTSLQAALHESSMKYVTFQKVCFGFLEIKHIILPH